MKARPLRGYYAILDLPDTTLPDAEAVRRRVEELLAAEPTYLQLRAKRLGGGALAETARVVALLCRAAGVPFCVNDRVDVALAVGADAVHVGQDDLPLADVRRVLAAVGRRLTVGVSTHGMAQAEEAAAAGADYIGFGPVFRTASKSNPDPVVGLALLAQVTAAVGVPVVAIGGITLDTVDAVAQAGAAAAAVIAAVDNAADRTAAARQIARAFA